jgi:hypothetical protein
VLPHERMLPCGASTVAVNVDQRSSAISILPRQDVPTGSAVRHTNPEPDLAALILRGLVRADRFGYGRRAG